MGVGNFLCEKHTKGGGFEIHKDRVSRGGNRGLCLVDRGVGTHGDPVQCAIPLTPGFELNGYASPFVSAGLLFPETEYAGIILEILEITGLAYVAKSDLTQTKNRTKNVTILAGILLVPIVLNVFFAKKEDEKNRCDREKNIDDYRPNQQFFIVFADDKRYNYGNQRS